MPTPSSATVKLDLVADLLDAQHDASGPAGKGMLDGVGRQLIDQKAEGHGAIGIDVQRLRP